MPSFPTRWILPWIATHALLSMRVGMQRDAKLPDAIEAYMREARVAAMSNVKAALFGTHTFPRPKFLVESAPLSVWG